MGNKTEFYRAEQPPVIQPWDAVSHTMPLNVSTALSEDKYMHTDGLALFYSSITSFLLLTLTT
jgi:hypothetical protein